MGQHGAKMTMPMTRILMRLTPPLALLGLPVVAGAIVGQLLGAEGKSSTLRAGSPEEALEPRCNPIPPAAALERLASSRKALLVAAPIDLGPSLLLLTHHQVLGAPYHRNIQGLRDTQRLLYSNEQSALEVIQRRGVDAIVVCRNDLLSKRARESGKLPFSDQLKYGNLPDWIQPFDSADDSGVFIVRGPIQINH
jgi:hypothetical protein